MKKLSLLVIMGVLFTSGCSTVTGKGTQEAVLSSVEFNRQNVETVIASVPEINLKEDELQGRHEYLNQVYFSIASKMAKLAGNPQFMKMPFKLTASMYDGDAGGFFVALDTLWLIEKGGLNEDTTDVAVLSTNNLWNSHTSNQMELASYNETIIKAVALSQLSDEKTEKQEQLNITSMWPRVMFNQYSSDKAENLESLNYVIFRGKSAAKFNPYHHFSKSSRSETKRKAFFLKASKEQAKAMLNKTYSIVFMPNAAFEIKKTGQLVVIADAVEAALFNEKQQRLSGHINPYYHYDADFFYPNDDDKFMCERIVGYVKSDQKDAPYRVHGDCK